MAKKGNSPQAEMSFLDHLEELRWHIVRALIAIVIVAMVAFAFKSFVFDILLFAPMNLNFPTYRMFCKVSGIVGELLNDATMGEIFCVSKINFNIINTELTGQFLSHIKISMILGFAIAFPYVLWEVWKFVKPALHKDEKKYATGMIFYCSLLFIVGLLFGYFILTPFSVNFLGNYSVSEIVDNQIRLTSYVAILSTLVMASAIIFELPVIIYFLSKIGLVTPQFLRKYRKHSIVIILIISGIITPPDVMSQIVLSFPLYFLYELGIVISARVTKKQAYV